MAAPASVHGSGAVALAAAAATNRRLNLLASGPLGNCGHNPAARSGSRRLVCEPPIECDATLMRAHEREELGGSKHELCSPGRWGGGFVGGAERMDLSQASGRAR